MAATSLLDLTGFANTDVRALYTRAGATWLLERTALYLYREDAEVSRLKLAMLDASGRSCNTSSPVVLFAAVFALTWRNCRARRSRHPPKGERIEPARL